MQSSVVKKEVVESSLDLQEILNSASFSAHRFRCTDRQIDLIAKTDLGPVVQKPIYANPKLEINQGVYFSTPKCCSTLILG